MRWLLAASLLVSATSASVLVSVLNHSPKSGRKCAPKSIPLPLYVTGDYGTNLSVRIAKSQSDVAFLSWSIQTYEMEEYPVKLFATPIDHNPDDKKNPHYVEVAAQQVAHDGLFPFNNYAACSPRNCLDGHNTPELRALLSQLRSPAVTISLERSELLSSDSVGGFLTFGDPDTDRCCSDWSYTAGGTGGLIYGAWTTNVVSFAIGNTILLMEQLAELEKKDDPFNYKPATRAIYASETPFITAPIDVTSAMTKYFGDIDNAYNGGYISCDKRASLPDVVIGLASGVNLTFSPFDYFRPRQNGDADCAFMFVPPGMGGTAAYHWVFGTSLLRPYCMMLDFDKRKIGFAPRKVN